MRYFVLPAPSTRPTGARRFDATTPSAAARNAAVSRTVRVTTPCEMMSMGKNLAPSGGTRRPLEGLRPTRPQHEAGMRIDPPPSFAWAIGTTPDATIAAEPPDDPPVEWFVFHGLRVGPWASDSVVAVSPSSGSVV